MIRILLACGIGASTGFMAANMRKAAKAQKLDVSIHAVSKSQVSDYADREMLKEHNVKVTSIDPDSYGALDGESILQDAIDFYHAG